MSIVPILFRKRRLGSNGRYNLVDGGVEHRPLAVFDAGTQKAWKRNFGTEDYRLPDGATPHTPLAVFDASNGIATRG